MNTAKVLSSNWHCSVSVSNQHKLHSVQNSLTRVILPSLRHLSASYLHCLPVHYRICLQFKIATLIYKTLATFQPSYLYNFLQAQWPSRALHSCNFSRYHRCLRILIGAPSPIALLLHGIPFPAVLAVAHLYIVSSVI